MLHKDKGETIIQRRNAVKRDFQWPEIRYDQGGYKLADRMMEIFTRLFDRALTPMSVLGLTSGLESVNFY